MDTVSYEDEFASTVCSLIKSGNVSDIKAMFQKLTPNDRKRLVNHKFQENGALFTACTHGNLELVQFFIDECEADIELKGVYVVDEADHSRHIVPPLWCASIANKLDLVSFLVDRGANLNAASDSNSTPVRAACFRNNFDIVQFLVEKGADISIPNKSGSTCLMNAVECPELCAFLISNGANVNRRDKNGLTALHYAIIYNNIQSVKVMLSNDADMQIRSDDGYDVLTMAALFSDHEVTKYLLENVEIFLRDRINVYDLMAARAIDDDDMDKRNEFLTESFTYRQVNPEIIIGNENSDLKFVFENFKEPKSFEELLQTSVNEQFSMMYAVMIKDRVLGSKDYNTVYSLLRYANVISDSDAWKSLKLFKYAFGLYVKDGKVLLDNCLYAASQLLLMLDRLKNDEVVRNTELVPTVSEMLTLLTMLHTKAKECPKEKLKEGRKSNNYLQVMKMCVDFLYFLSTLQLPEKEKHKVYLGHKVKGLLATDPRTQDKGLSMLHLAVDPDTITRYYNIGSVCYDDLDAEFIKFLIQCGADVNVFDNRKNTPVHICIEYIHSRRIPDNGEMDVLLRHGAHIDLPNEDGKTALDLMKLYDIPIQELQYCNLQCLAARVIKRENIKYSNDVPTALITFVDKH